MHVTVWTYPWDVARLGAATVVDDLLRQGADGIDLAATYHPISALSPRGDHVQGFFSPRGGVFFPARPERYGRIRPSVWPDQAVTDAWPAIAERAAEGGLELNAWTIGLFQPWMAQDYPHVARVYPSGERVDAGVCPSNPDVRDYLAALSADLADQFPLRLIKLEGVRSPAFDYGWIRRRIYFGLTPLQQELLAMCFCDGCTAMARSGGIDVETVRTGVIDRLRIDQHSPIADNGGSEFLAQPEISAYRNVARDAAVLLVR